MLLHSCRSSMDHHFDDDRRIKFNYVTTKTNHRSNHQIQHFSPSSTVMASPAPIPHSNSPTIPNSSKGRCLMTNSTNQQQSSSGISFSASSYEEKFTKKARCLPFLIHASRCTSALEGSCKVEKCVEFKKLWNHIKICKVTTQCEYYSCSDMKNLLKHFKYCTFKSCKACAPTRSYLDFRKSSLVANTISQFKSTESAGYDHQSRVNVSEPQSKRRKTDNSSNNDAAVVSSLVENPKVVEKESDCVMQVTEKVTPLSLLELLTREEIEKHITSLKRWAEQKQGKEENTQILEEVPMIEEENICQLCNLGKLTFKPSPVYCCACDALIRRKSKVYTVKSGESLCYLCTKCFNNSGNDIVMIDGTGISKKNLESRVHNEEYEEGWVQCDKCESWQHQVCALFNDKRIDKDEVQYTCPCCCIKDIEREQRTSLSQTPILGAKDLPRTALSDFIERRLSMVLKKERLQRAENSGKSYEEVLGAEGIVVRVVSSVDKMVHVKQQFQQMSQEVNYPKEFPYISKLILLFQNIQGIDVCIFGMYVQEFGSECPAPNQRRVYISYLDSVKFFTPNIAASNGEALRTLVYHELLISYLANCKIRGFSSCYIWSCAPKKGDNYIFYCRPEDQKTPKSNELREWYFSMLRKATKERVVASLTNLYDHFFLNSQEDRDTVISTRLPYFDGDYWPDMAEHIISEPCFKSTFDHSAKDKYLIKKLCKSIRPKKEDFIIINLHHVCNQCGQSMMSGCRWMCNICGEFQLCGKCHDEEQTIAETQSDPMDSNHKHVLSPSQIRGVPVDTKDVDESFKSKFFETRHAFLSLCKDNHYQFDTLRQAKHSSMMILYHLHNPTALEAQTERSYMLQIECFPIVLGVSRTEIFNEFRILARWDVYSREM